MGLQTRPHRFSPIVSITGTDKHRLFFRQKWEGINYLTHHGRASWHIDADQSESAPVHRAAVSAKAGDTPSGVSYMSMYEILVLNIPFFTGFFSYIDMYET